jgi:hypothetical protein
MNQAEPDISDRLSAGLFAYVIVAIGIFRKITIEYGTWLLGNFP